MAKTLKPNFVLSGLEMAEGYTLGLYLNKKDRERLGIDRSLFESPEAKSFLLDIDANYLNWTEQCNASKQTWDWVRMQTSMLSRTSRIDNGLEVLKARKRKMLKANELRTQMKRLMDDDDHCIDLVGTSEKIELLDSVAIAKEAHIHFNKKQSYKGRLKAFNEYLKYFGDGSVYILSACSSVGKTTIAFNIFEDSNIIYYGIDMTLPDIAKRAFEINAYKEAHNASLFLTNDFASIRKLVSDLWESEKVDDKKILARLMPKMRMPDRSYITIEEIDHSLQKEIELGRKPQAVVIDFLDKVSSTHNFAQDHERSKYVIRYFKEMAKRLKIAFFILAQYNGNAEEHKVGRINWLAGSREIMPNVDGIICAWRSAIKHPESGQEQNDMSHIWLSNSLKARDTGTFEDMRVACKGLYLTDFNDVELTW